MGLRQPIPGRRPHAVAPPGRAPQPFHRLDTRSVSVDPKSARSCILVRWRYALRRTDDSLAVSRDDDTAPNGPSRVTRPDGDQPCPSGSAVTQSSANPKDESPRHGVVVGSTTAEEDWAQSGPANPTQPHISPTSLRLPHPDGPLETPENDAVEAN
jgi:hypothetical protein